MTWGCSKPDDLPPERKKKEGFYPTPPTHHEAAPIAVEILYRALPLDAISTPMDVRLTLEFPLGEWAEKFLAEVIEEYGE